MIIILIIMIVIIIIDSMIIIFIVKHQEDIYRFFMTTKLQYFIDRWTIHFFVERHVYDLELANYNDINDMMLWEQAQQQQTSQFDSRDLAAYNASLQLWEQEFNDWTYYIAAYSHNFSTYLSQESQYYKCECGSGPLCS